MKFSNDMKFVMVDDQMVFPLVTNAENNDIRWTLRYGSEENIIKQRLYIASIVSAYDELIKTNYRRKNYILSSLKKAIKFYNKN